MCRNNYLFHYFRLNKGVAAKKLHAGTGVRSNEAVGMHVLSCRDASNNCKRSDLLCLFIANCHGHFTSRLGNACVNA